MEHENNIFLSTSIELTEVNVSELLIGMYVSKLDRPWLKTTFKFQGFELKTRADIEEVQKQCHFVYIDVKKTKRHVTIRPRATPFSQHWLERRNPPKRKSNFSHEFVYAESVHKRTSNLVKSFMEDVHIGRAINVEIAKKAVSECVNSVMNSPDALMWLTQLKNKDEYTSQHSMNVCILSIALARQINLPEHEIQDIGLCGMMHDMGKMKIPMEILNKPGRFEPEEYDIMKTHPGLGMQILMSSNDIPGCVIDAAYGHHERLDGKGYPRGLLAESIHPYTRIVSIADTYDAIASDRIYKEGITHLETINILTRVSGEQLDSGLVIKFIESLGIYPPGNIVEMNSGEVAVVVETNYTKRLKPKITVLLDKDKKLIKPRLIDMAKMSEDAAGKSYTIKRMVRADKYGFDLNKLYEMKVVQDSLVKAK